MLWICNNDEVAYSVDAPRCPQCGADDHRDEGTEKPEKPTEAAAEAPKK